MHVRRGASGCEAYATTTIEGQNARIVDIFVALSGKTTVEHIELTGRANDGRRVVERIHP